MSTATTEAAAPAAATPSSFAMIRTLGGIALLSGVLLAVVYQGTFDIIKRNKEELIRSAVFTVIPGAEQQVLFELQDSGELLKVDGDPTGLPPVYAGYDANGELVGIALGAANNQGYGGEIKVLYGYSPDAQQITGLKVLESKETPGLGDRIAKEPFMSNFSAMDVTMENGQVVHPIELVKSGTKTEAWQVDGITGATISSKAITNMLKDGTEQMLPIVRNQLDTLKGGTQ